MIFRIILTILILLSLIAESTIIPFPFVFLFCCLYVLFYDDLVSFATAFVACIMLDILVLHHVGFLAVFLFGAILTIKLIEKLFSVQGPLLIGLSVLFGIEIYRYMVGYPFSFLLTNIYILGLVAYLIFDRSQKKKQSAVFK